MTTTRNDDQAALGRLVRQYQAEGLDFLEAAAKANGSAVGQQVISGSPPEAAPTPATVAPAGDPLDSEVQRELNRREVRRRADDIEHARAWTPPEDVGNLETWLRQPARPARFRVAGMLGVGHNAVLIAGRKAGKTTVIDNLVRTYADDWPFLNRFTVTPTGRGVAIFNYEVEQEQYREWLRETGITNTHRVYSLNLRGKRLPLINPRVQAWVAAWLAERDIGLWIVDPYSRAYVGSVDNGNDEAQVGRFLDTLDVIKAEGGVDELVMPVHTPKAQAEAGQESAIGSQRLEAWPDAMWYLTRDVMTGGRYLRAEGRDVDQPERPLSYDAATRMLALDLNGGTRAAVRADADAAALLAYVREHPDCSVRDAVGGLGWGSPREAKARRTALEAGLIRVKDLGRGKGFSLSVVDPAGGVDE